MGVNPAPRLCSARETYLVPETRGTPLNHPTRASSWEQQTPICVATRNMKRCLFDGNEVFRETTDYHAKDLEGSLEQRRAEMKSAWEEIDEGWEALEKRMAEIGVRPAGENESMIRLNVGGAPVDIWRQTLSSTPGMKSSRLGALLEGVWDNRVPRDEQGRMVLDESPSCFKNLVEAMLARVDPVAGRISSPALPPSAAEGIASHDEEYHDFLDELFFGPFPGLRPAPSPRSNESVNETRAGDRDMATLSGLSTVMRGRVSERVLAQLRKWLPDERTATMNLLYRASRDGHEPLDFLTLCGRHSPTLTLIKFHRTSDQARTLVLGGFKTTPWTVAPPTENRSDSGSFAFLLRDGTQGDRAERLLVDDVSFRPSKGTDGHWEFSLEFGGNLLAVWVSQPRHAGSHSESSGDAGAGARCVMTSTGWFGSKAHVAEDVEVYSVETSPPPAVEPRPAKYRRAGVAEKEAADIRSFGAAIAGCLVRERRALKKARAELDAATARVAAAGRALEAVYGPRVASGGDGDATVELSVRGVSMATLRSTLLACPESALAAGFDEEKWRSEAQTKDGRGRRFIDSDPLCFGKILDVLRVRKRIAWADSVEAPEGGAEVWGLFPGSPAVMVGVPTTHQARFEALVNMYFPGTEGFITDLVIYVTPDGRTVSR